VRSRNPYAVAARKTDCHRGCGHQTRDSRGASQAVARLREKDERDSKSARRTDCRLIESEPGLQSDSFVEGRILVRVSRIDQSQHLFRYAWRLRRPTHGKGI